MADIFKYINAMYCIRDEQFNPIRDQSVIVTTDIADVHKRILKKAYDDGNTNAFLFQNELYFIRTVGDINNNEIKQFLMTNATWDVMILNPRTDLSTTPVAGYEHVERVNSTGFNTDKAYLVSRRCMAKIKNNELTNIETYYYDNTFVDAASVDTYVHKLKVGKLTNIGLLDNEHIKYNWNSFEIPLS